MARNAEPDKKPDIHAGVIPEKCAFATRILRGEPLRQHHVDAGDIETTAGEEKGETDVEQYEGTGGDAGAPEPLECHASNKQIAVRQETAAQITAEQVQAVVEGA